MQKNVLHDIDVAQGNYWDLNDGGRTLSEAKKAATRAFAEINEWREAQPHVTISTV